MKESIETIKKKFNSELAAAYDLETLEKVRVRFLGKKGEITSLMKSLGQVTAEEKPLLGKELNQFKKSAEKMLEERKTELKSNTSLSLWEKERLDVTLPGKPFKIGRKHPLISVLKEMEEIFTCMGFQVVEGPDVEMDYYNFEALNIPQDHPARDMQDSFYITPDVLLRTHTSPVQIRTMEAQAPTLPVRVIAPGKVYRRDDDLTHSPMFHQVEGLVVDKGISMGDLKGTLLLFAREMFGSDREIRLRPSYFPFTEPSAEVDILCIICDGRGCRTCGDSGWMEILGSGMVHPKVLRISGYDPENVTGYAFGMGVERIAMLKYGIDDIRTFYNNDLRMLKQHQIS